MGPYRHITVRIHMYMEISIVILLLVHDKHVMIEKLALVLKRMQTPRLRLELQLQKTTSPIRFPTLLHRRGKVTFLNKKDDAIAFM